MKHQHSNIPLFPFSKRSRAGFSMVEVLVAASILVVIVMMLGMLFQQTSLAWRTGVRRADSFMQVRSGVGAIQRDASAAVDARSLPQADDQQQFSGSLLFYTLAGGVEFDSNGTILKNRVVKKIRYYSTGKRFEETLSGDGRSWVNLKESNVLTFVERKSSKNRPSSFKADFGKAADGLASDGLPLAVTFQARVTTSGNNLDIGAASAGPDRVWGTADDIKTWVEK